MTLSRRNALKIGLGASAAALLDARTAAALGMPRMDTPSQSSLTPSGAKPPRTLAARPLPLHDVRLLGGPLKTAQDADITYLLELEPDRMLAFYRQNAGLAPKAKGYGGWDGDNRNLTGHIAGHYLSAISAMWAATGDVRFKDRATYIVNELKLVQDKHGDGYLVALKGGRKCFDALAKGDIRASAFDLNGEWSPWYVLHKTFAGLRDAYRFTGNKTALSVETKFAGWAEGVLAHLDEAQRQHMMETEFGGMNEVLADLYGDSGDPRWLTLSYAFEHTAFVAPLQRHEDDLDGTHANTQIPKLIGSAARYMYTQQPADLTAASFFYDRVVRHHSFSTGGHGTDEYYGAADRIGARVHGRTAESCNVYNMLKLSRQLFALAPDARYADYVERGLFNHALASFDTEARRMCYMVPVGPNARHEYQDMLESFTCCVGTGMENFALAGDGLYHESGDTLWVNVYAPSSARWASAGASLTITSDCPEGETAKLTVALTSPKRLTLALRRPYWAGDGFSIKVNGVAVASPITEFTSPADPARRRQYAPRAPESSYVKVTRQWRDGDVVEVTLPKSLRLEPTPDMPNRAAIMWGPLVLAGDLGPETQRGRRRGENGELLDADTAATQPVVTPILVAGGRPIAEWLCPVDGKPGTFRTAGVGHEPDAAGAAHDVVLVPFYRLQRRVYTTYWDITTDAEWAEQRAALGRDAERQRRLEAATVAFVRPGNAASEKTFGYQGGPDAAPQNMNGRTGRSARSWFSYAVPVVDTRPMALVATYYTADRRTTPSDFEILVDGTRVAEEKVGMTDPGRFYDVVYAIPAAMVAGKQAVTVRFQARERSQVAALYGVRIVRADELP
jgi:DUF1680 family protein